MFTVKYRTYNLGPKQSSDGPALYDEVEMIYGTFELISKVQDEDGRTVIHCHPPGGAPWLTLTNCNHDDDGPDVAGVMRPPRSTCWIMNEQGATVAKYDL